MINEYIQYLVFTKGYSENTARLYDITLHSFAKAMQGRKWSEITAEDITNYLIRGENTLKLTLYSGLRNLFGPHHHVYGKHYYTGPSVFEGFKEWQDTVVYPELPQKTYTEEYSFVPFGAKGIYIERQAKK